jgi:hypothetical protein
MLYIITPLMFFFFAAKIVAMLLFTSAFPQTPPKCFVVVDFEGRWNSRNCEGIRVSCFPFIYRVCLLFGFPLCVTLHVLFTHQDLERELNYFWKSFGDNKDKLLLHIMQKAAVLVDVYLECKWPETFPKHLSIASASK